MEEQRQFSSLAAGLLANDPAAIDEFVEQASQRLYWIGVRQGANDIDDLVQEAIFRTLTKLPSIDLEQGTSQDPLFSYLAKVMQNLIYQQRRDQAKARRALERVGNHDLGAGPPVHQLDADGGTPLWAPRAEAGADMVPSPAKQVVSAFLATLSQENRLLLELRVSAQMEWDEIAAELGISHDNARQRGSRLLRRLKDTLENAEESLNVERRPQPSTRGVGTAADRSRPNGDAGGAGG